MAGKKPNHVKLPMLKKRTVMLTDQLIDGIKTTAARDGREFSAQLREHLKSDLARDGAKANA